MLRAIFTLGVVSVEKTKAPSKNNVSNTMSETGNFFFDIKKAEFLTKNNLGILNFEPHCLT